MCNNTIDERRSQDEFGGILKVVDGIRTNNLRIF